MKKKFFSIALMAFLSQTAFSAPILHTSGFINAVERTNFVDFESMGAMTTFGSTFTQDSVTVNQVNGVLTTCGLSCWLSNSTMTWYPDGGDNGWTEIARADASDFINIGSGSGFSSSGKSVQYELLNNGLSILLDFIVTPTSADGYIGFSGGGFDQIRLHNTLSSGSFGDGALSALATDNIELSGTAPVLEPGTLALLGLGFGFVCRVFTAAPQSLISATIPANKKESARSPLCFRVLQNEQRIRQSGEWPLDPSILFLQRHIQNLYPMPNRNSGHTLNMRQAAYISGGNNIGHRTFQ